MREYRSSTLRIVQLGCLVLTVGVFAFIVAQSQIVQLKSPELGISFGYPRALGRVEQRVTDNSTGEDPDGLTRGKSVHLTFTSRDDLEATAMTTDFSEPRGSRPSEVRTYPEDACEFIESTTGVHSCLQQGSTIDGRAWRLFIPLHDRIYPHLTIAATDASQKNRTILVQIARSVRYLPSE